MEQVTISKEDIDKIKSLQTRFNNNAHDLGQLTQNIEMVQINLNQLNSKKTELVNNFTALIKEEDELTNLIKTRYGEGEIDLQTGKLTKK